MTPLLSLDDRDLAIVALALESFADQSRQAIKGIEDTAFMRPVREQLARQIEHTEALLKRVIEARS